MRSKRNIFKKNPLFEKCPSCSSLNTLHRSRARSWKETFVKNTTFFRMYRCRQCGWRGYLSTFSITFYSLKILLYYMAIAAVVAFIVKEILKRFVL